MSSFEKGKPVCGQGWVSVGNSAVALAALHCCIPCGHQAPTCMVTGWEAELAVGNSSQPLPATVPRMPCMSEVLF